MIRYRTVTEILDAVSKVSTRKEKIKILEYNNSAQLKKIFRLAYMPNYEYIKIPKYEKIKNGYGMQLNSALNFLENQIIRKNITGKSAENQLKTVLISVTAEQAGIIERIMNHDMQCGVGKGIAKKVWKNLYK